MFNSTLRTRRAAPSASAVTLHDVRKVHGRGEGAVVALDGVGGPPQLDPGSGCRELAHALWRRVDREAVQDVWHGASLSVVGWSGSGSHWHICRLGLRRPLASRRGHRDGTESTEDGEALSDSFSRNAAPPSPAAPAGNSDAATMAAAIKSLVG